MVAYSFNRRFEMPIVTLRKTGTAAGRDSAAVYGDADTGLPAAGHCHLHVAGPPARL